MELVLHTLSCLLPGLSVNWLAAVLRRVNFSFPRHGHLTSYYLRAVIAQRPRDRRTDCRVHHQLSIPTARLLAAPQAHRSVVSRSETKRRRSRSHPDVKLILTDRWTPASRGLTRFNALSFRLHKVANVNGHRIPRQHLRLRPESTFPDPGFFSSVNNRRFDSSGTLRWTLIPIGIRETCPSNDR